MTKSLIKKITKRILFEGKTDELSLHMSRAVVDNFKKKENFKIESLYVEKGDEYAVFDLVCNFYEDNTMDEPFSINAAADMEEIELAIEYNSNYFPMSMNDFVAEVKETIEHELEHVEQQNFEGREVFNDEDIHHDDEDFNFKYLTSNVEIPAYVRGLIKRAKTKKILLIDAMDEWAMENKKKFKNFESEWPVIKDLWMFYAIDNIRILKKFN